MIVRRWLGWIIGAVLATVGGIILIVVGSSESSSVRSDIESRGLPVMEIWLDGVELEEIDSGSKNEKYEGNMLSLHNDGVVTDYENVEMKGRGNGTWAREKKPYQIKFAEKVDLLGMGAAKKWYLLANAMDSTNLRTETAVYLEGMLGMKYVFDGEFIELYVDGDYRGLYYLTHAVEISKKTVDLRDPLGVLVELDNIYGNIESDYVTSNGDKIVVKDLVSKEKRDEAMMGFLAAYNELEKAIADGDYAKVQEVIDVESFVEYYLLSEFTVNPDAYWTSFYMYKDGNDDKIHAGPGWDFDLSLANVAWGNWMGEKFYSPTEKMIRRQEVESKEWCLMYGGEDRCYSGDAQSRVMFNLIDFPEFEAEVKRIFQERIAGRLEELVLAIKQQASMVRNAAYVNNEKWGSADFDEEVQKMIDWVRERYWYFEREYGGDEVENRELV